MEGKQAVDVISLCSAAGEIRPLRLRLEDESQQLRRVDIVEVVSEKQIPYVGAEAYIFVCRVSSVCQRDRLQSAIWCLVAFRSICRN